MMAINPGAIYILFRKELRIMLRTKRLIVIGIIFAIVFVVMSLYGGYIIGAGEHAKSPNDVFAMVVNFTSFFPQILAIALAYDTIVGEYNNKSLYLLLSKPVKKHDIFLGKYLAVTGAIAIIYLIVGTIGYLIAGLFIGMPSIEEIAKIYGGVVVIILGASAWASIIMLYSAAFKTQVSTIIMAVVSWIIIFPLISQSGLIYYGVSQANKNMPPTFSFQLEQKLEDVWEMKVIAKDYNVPLEDAWNITFNATDGVDEVSTHTKALRLYLLKDQKYEFSILLGDKKYSDNIIYPLYFNILTVDIVQNDTDGKRNDLMCIFSLRNYTDNLQVLLEDSRGNVVNVELLNADGGTIAMVNDVDEGDYYIIIVHGNSTIFKFRTHSYGDNIRMDFITLISSGKDVPDYVKYTYAINPGNAMNVAPAIITGTEETFILDIPTAIYSLIILNTMFLILGLSVFSKREYS